MSKVKQKKTFQATTLRLTLVIILVMTLLGMTGGFYWFYTSLKSTADEVAKVKAEASATDLELQRLKALEQELKQYSGAMEKSQQIVAESQSYQYQNQIISDLTSYAGKAGLSITSFNFQSQSSQASTSTSSSNTAASTSTAAGSAPGPKTVQVSIQLGENPRYQNILQFIRLIEQNLTRMQISEVSLARGEGDSVNTQLLNIEVYVR